MSAIQPPLFLSLVGLACRQIGRWGGYRVDTTVQDVVVALAGIAALLTSLGVIGAFLHFAIVRPLRKYIKEFVLEVSIPAKATAKQLETKNGKNAGEFIEDSAHSLVSISKQLEAMNKTLVTATERGIENRGLIAAGHTDHVEHLLKYHANPDQNDIT